MTNDEILLDKINEAIALGVSSITHGNKTTTYRSLKDMRDIRNDLMKRIARANGVNNQGRGSVYQPAFKRGYH